MATADVDIVNSALVKLGVPTIAALTDNVKAAKAMNTIYAARRKNLLSSHPWNFSTFRVELALTANTPEFYYSSEFLLPSDVLRVFDTDLPENAEWEVEFNTDNNKVIVCNADSLKIKYAKDITDPTKFSPYFEEAFAWDLAAQTVYNLTQSASFSKDIYNTARLEIAIARSYDAQEASRNAFEANEWFDVRN